MPLKGKRGKAASSSTNNLPKSASAPRGVKRKSSSVEPTALRQATIPATMNSKTPAHQEASMSECPGMGQPLAPLQYPHYSTNCKYGFNSMQLPSMSRIIKPPQFRLHNSYPSGMKCGLTPEHMPFALRIDSYNPACAPTGGRSHRPPLLHVTWAHIQELWDLMCCKDAEYRRDPAMMDRHPQLLPKMRSILFDWLAEVAEVYKLHRETFHLCMDLVDRYLSHSINAPKAKLQLLGITCMFIAAKLEEIYPPKCDDFAYVTDGACTAEDIRSMEMIVLKSVGYSLTPMTAVHWLTVFLQVHYNMCNVDDAKDMTKSLYDRHILMQLCLLVDVCLMDVASTQFSYGLIAASAIMLMLNPQHAALDVSGFTLADIAPCIDWMTPYSRAVDEWLDEHPLHLKNFEGVFPDNLHNIQTHEFDTKLFERANEIKQDLTKLRRVSPPTVMDIFPTPPQSAERSQVVQFMPFYQPHS